MGGCKILSVELISDKMFQFKFVCVEFLEVGCDGGIELEEGWEVDLIIVVIGYC